MLFKLLDERFMVIIEFGPDLDSEHVLAIKTALVKQTDAGEHVWVDKCVSHHAEDQLFPEGLQERQCWLEVNLYLATLFVYFIFPLRLDAVFE